MLASKDMTSASTPLTSDLDTGLVDPATLDPLVLSPDGEWLLGPGGRQFPVVDGIPALLEETVVLRDTPEVG